MKKPLVLQWKKLTKSKHHYKTCGFLKKRVVKPISGYGFGPWNCNTRLDKLWGTLTDKLFRENSRPCAKFTQFLSYCGAVSTTGSPKTAKQVIPLDICHSCSPRREKSGNPDFIVKSQILFFIWCFSLNSLSVRVPQNISSRVSETRTPDPWLVAGGCWLLAVAGTGFIVKPMVFQS